MHRHHRVTAAGGHRVQISMNIDHPADHRRIHRVVVAQDPRVVVARQPGPGGEPDRRRHRRQSRHRRPIHLDQFGRRRAQAPNPAAVRAHQPLGELGVKIGR